jgi:hypothetical protein
MRRLRRKLTYSNVVSTLCLFLLVGGGTALAANELGKNSVGTPQIRDGAVTAAKLHHDSVNGSKVDLSTLGTVPKAAKAAHATDATQLGGVAADEYQQGVMWARVAADGTILAQSGDIKSLHFNGNALYSLQFPQRVAGHAVLTSPAFQTDQQGGNITVLATPCGGETPDSTHCSPDPSLDTPHTLFVETVRNGSFADAGFYAVVFP